MKTGSSKLAVHQVGCSEDVEDDISDLSEEDGFDESDESIDDLRAGTVNMSEDLIHLSSKVASLSVATEGMSNSMPEQAMLNVQGLNEALESTQLYKCINSATAWCEEQGAVSVQEVVEDFEDFADALGLKKLERKRLLRHLNGMLSSEQHTCLPLDQDSIDILINQALRHQSSPKIADNDCKISLSSPSSSSSCDSTSASSGQLSKPSPKLAWTQNEVVEKSVKISRSAPAMKARMLPAPSGRSPIAHPFKITEPHIKSMLAGSISQCPLFAGLPAAALDAVMNATEIQDAEAVGSVVFFHGSDAQSMFFVMSGKVKIQSSSGVTLATVCEQGFFGEIGVLFAGQRTASAIVSEGPCKLAKLNRPELVQAAHAHGFQDQLFDRGQSLASVRMWFANKLPLFSGCVDEPGFLNKVASALDVKKSKAGETLIREGEEGNEMFFIFDGTVTVAKKRANGPVVRLNSPNFFGELALLFAEPRSATVVCSAQCRLYVLSRQQLHEILQEYPKAIGSIYSTAKEAASLKAHFIRKIPLFQSMANNEEFVANVSMALESCAAGPGEFLVRQGQASDGRMFAIAHGHAEVLKVKKAGIPASVVATLSAGAFFGEVALLLDTPRMASVVARGHCHMYTLSRDAFETLAVVYEDWWRGLMSEQGVLMKQVEDSGVGIGAATKTQTHGLQIPEIQGTSVSAMLCAAEEPEEVDCSIPEDRVCLVCRSAEKAMLSVPCGHISSCASCHEALKSCPICRVSITGGHRAFF